MAKSKKKEQPKKSVGRPPIELTPVRRAKFLQGIRDANTVRIACKNAGFGVGVYNRFRREAREGDPEKMAFVEEVDRAQAEVITPLIAIIKKAASHDWRAAVWLLTKLAPDDFGSDSQELRTLKKELAQLAKAVDEIINASQESTP
jgi:hypothetical protein